jgi:hypothetical protein
MEFVKSIENMEREWEAADKMEVQCILLPCHLIATYFDLSAETPSATVQSQPPSKPLHTA